MRKRCSKTKNLFLVSYLIIVLVIVLMLFPLYASCVRLFETRQLEMNQSVLINGMERLCQQTANLSAISSEMGQNTDYRILAARPTSEMSANSLLRLHTIQKDFYRLLSTQSFISQSGLLMQNGALFLDKRLFTAEQPYYGTYISYQDMSAQEWAQRVRQVGRRNEFWPAAEVVCLPEQSQATSYRCITWLSNISGFKTSRPVGILFVTVSEDTLRKQLLAGLEDGAGIVLYDSLSGKELIRLGNPLAFEDSGAHVLEYAAASSPLTARLMITDALFYMQTLPIRNLLLFFIAMLIVTGTLTAWTLSRRSMKPVNRLVSLVKDRPEAERAGGDGFEYIGSAVTGMLDSMKRCELAMDEQRRRDTENILEHFLSTPYADRESVPEAKLSRFVKCFPDFPPQYRLALLTVLEGSDTQITELGVHLTDMLAKLYPPPVPYAQRIENAFVLLLGAQEDTQRLTLIRSGLLQASPCKLLITLSEVFAGCENLHNSFSQSAELTYLARSQGELLAVWRSENFPNAALQPRRGNLLSYQELGPLYDALLRGKAQEVQAFLSRIEHCFSPVAAADVVMAQQMFYNIRGVLLQIKLEHFDSLCGLDIPTFRVSPHPSGSCDELRQCCSIICEAMQRARDSTPPFSKLVCGYIDQNISNPELYARMVADHFAISEPTLQKMVRLEKNSSFFDYLEYSRCTLAVRLLEETEKPISQIAEDCGYHSLNSFYKAFKRNKGVTPKAVRLQSR